MGKQRAERKGDGYVGSLTVEYKKKCSQVLWYLLFLCQIIRFIL